RSPSSSGRKSPRTSGKPTACGAEGPRTAPCGVLRRGIAATSIQVTPMSPPHELAGRVALITGGGRNIGRAIALALAQAGAGVVVNGRKVQAAVESVVAEIAAAGGKATGVMGDVTDEAAMQRLAAEAVRHFGRLDILVNNAAVRPETPLEAMSL